MVPSPLELELEFVFCLDKPEPELVFCLDNLCEEAAVLGSLLFAGSDPFLADATDATDGLLPFRLVGLSAREPLIVLIPWRCLGVLDPSKKPIDWLARLNWGEEGIEWLESKCGGVVDALVRRIGRFLELLLLKLSLSSHDLTSSCAMLRTRTAESESSRLRIVSSRPSLLRRPPCSSVESHILRTIRRILSRMAGLWCFSFFEM